MGNEFRYGSSKVFSDFLINGNWLGAVFVFLYYFFHVRPFVRNVKYATITALGTNPLSMLLVLLVLLLRRARLGHLQTDKALVYAIVTPWLGYD